MTPYPFMPAGRRRAFAAEAGIAEGVTIVMTLAVATAMMTAIATSTTGLVDSIGQSVRSGAAMLSRPVELQGVVLARASEADQRVSELLLPVTLGTSESVSFDAADPNAVVVGFRDDAEVDLNVPYEAIEVKGDGDLVLERGELFQLVVRAADIASERSTEVLGPGSTLVLDIGIPGGGHSEIKRRLPPILQPLMELH